MMNEMRRAIKVARQGILEVIYPKLLFNWHK